MRVMSRVPTLRKKFTNAELSCGREVLTARVPRSKRVWWCCGVAMEKFEKEIAPKIDETLRNVDLGYADIFVRLYMIGSRPNSSRPIIMVCCTDATVRANAETEIRKSGLLDGFPEYGTGQSALPLEQRIVSRPLVGKEPRVYVQTSKDEASLTPSVAIGRSLVFEGQSCRYHATGGAIITIGAEVYQLTVGHIGQSAGDTDNSAEPANEDLNECRFEGMSDDEESIGDLSADLVDTTSRGSRSPDNEGFWGYDSQSGIDDLSETSLSTTPKSGFPVATTQRGTGPSQRGRFAQNRSTSSPSTNKASPLKVMTSHVLEITSLADRSADGPNPSLDYALVPLGSVTSALARAKNEVRFREDDEKPLLVREVAEVKASETRILAVTGVGGPSTGVLIPGATYFRARGHRSFQKLYAVQLDSTRVFEGDCGSVVIGEAGELYGHIVRGCPGTTLAYMVPATEVFADITARRKTYATLSMPSQAPLTTATRPSDDVADWVKSSRSPSPSPEANIPRAHSGGHRVSFDTSLQRRVPPSLPRRDPRPSQDLHGHAMESPGFEERHRQEGIRASFDTLQRHNQVLKAQLQAKEKSLKDQQAWIDELELEMHGLKSGVHNQENESQREIKTQDLRKKNQLEAENDKLKSQVREVLKIAKEATDDRVRLLKDEVKDKDDQIAEWRRRYQDADRRLARMRENLNDHFEANRRLTEENERLRRLSGIPQQATSQSDSRDRLGDSQRRR
ncbi:hypothetical protein QBC34DRAFT_415596 [Podospora aff. communis PSN243]|uniref:Uncharacterized protein n=1 Tax=Podospora aff. communis PSN243 TaxID=3040156 RepID=A0AAV9G823_9PEZI|nr:hypothetical protein QBC34DRAFT_415596 [Podospora aff. communis PSN243]